MSARSLVALSLLLATPALAGGFAISEHDAAASGRSGTAVAQAGTPSSIHYNPAGLATLDQAAAAAGVTAIMPSISAQDPAGAPAERSQTSLRTPPYAYAAYGFGRLSAGLGLNAPFGGGVSWPEDWRGRFELTEQRLEVFAGHGALAFQVNDQLSVGAAVSAYQVNIALRKRIDVVDGESQAFMGGSGVAVGGGAGLQFRATEALTLGLSGRLPATASLSGRVHFTEVPAAFAPVLQDQALTTKLTLPAKLAAGMSATFAQVRLFADVEYTFWSAFKSLDIDFAQPNTPDTRQAQDWANAFTVRLGAEKDWAETTFRAGAFVDQAAAPTDTLTPSLPDSTRLGFSLGAGRDLGPVRGDAAYMFVAYLPRSSSGDAFPANYNASAHLLGLSVSWSQKHQR